jgi:DNA polymerase III delta subunit
MTYNLQATSHSPFEASAKEGKLILLHGENTTASRNHLVELISQAKLEKSEVLNFNGKKATHTEIRQALDTPSLFGNQRLLVIEQLHSRPKSKEQSAIFTLLTQDHPQTTTILWESKPLTPSQAKKFTQAKVELFKLEVFVWKFLDSLAPGNAPNTLKLFQNSLSTHPSELLFALIVKRFRLLLAAQDGGAQALKNLGTSAPWQQKIITHQSRKFSTQQLISSYQQLLNIDYTTKTGQSPLSLQQSLEQFLIHL